jgi:hypothetical protein
MEVPAISLAITLTRTFWRVMRGLSTTERQMCATQQRPPWLIAYGNMELNQSQTEGATWAKWRIQVMEELNWVNVHIPEPYETNILKLGVQISCKPTTK